MSTRESKVFARLKGKILRPMDRFERIENGIGIGMPDTNYCMAGEEGWIEIKCPIAPKHDSTPLFGSNHQVSIDQRNWMLAQANAGGRCFLFIATEELLMLLRGERVARMNEINSLTVEQLQHEACWSAAVPIAAGQVWIDLRGILTGAKR